MPVVGYNEEDEMVPEKVQLEHSCPDDEFPWLRHIDPICKKICWTLRKKEVHYKGSWQKRGGPGAFMMLARKWDRIESIAQEHGYDIFEAMMKNNGDIVDDIDDLIGYLVLCRAELVRRQQERMRK